MERNDEVMETQEHVVQGLVQHAGRLGHKLRELVSRGTVQLLGDGREHQPRRVSTGVLALDEALGGGLPSGKIAELAGAPASGKTHLALSLCRAVQERGGLAAYIDVEHGLELSVVSRAGVDAERLVVARPDGGEQALHIVDELVRASACDLIVVDSVSALVPAAELQGMTGAAPAGHLSRLMSQALRRLALMAAKHNVTIVFVNQFRRTWGDDGKGSQTTTGGSALHYAAAVRLVVIDDHVVITKSRVGKAGVVVPLSPPVA